MKKLILIATSVISTIVAFFTKSSVTNEYLVAKNNTQIGLGVNMLLYVLLLEGEEEQYPYGVYSSLENAKAASEIAEAEDSDDDSWTVRVVGLDHKGSFCLRSGPEIVL